MWGMLNGFSSAPVTLENWRQQYGSFSKGLVPQKSDKVIMRPPKPDIKKTAVTFDPEMKKKAPNVANRRHLTGDKYVPSARWSQSEIVLGG